MPTAFNPKTEAEELLSAQWFDEGYPVDPTAIARRLGIDVFVANLPADVSGMLVKREGEPPTIYLNADDPDSRQRFTCAHEIGHYMKHVGDGTHDLSFVDRRDPLATRGTDREEIEANGFAANLLMPAGTVQWRAKGGDSAADLADYFGVSLATVKNRLSNLRLA